MAIDWTKPECKIAQFFTVKDALWLPQWNRLASAKDGLGPTQIANLVMLFQKLDLVRGVMGKPMIVHVTFRSYSYNKLIGGAENSAHIQGMACDFHVAGVPCDDVRAKLLPLLEGLGMRMENKPRSTWIHLDTRPVGAGGSRFFKP